MALVAKTDVKMDTWGDNVQVVQWPLALQSSTFERFECPGAADRSVQVEGTFNGASIGLEGSNDGTTYHALNDLSGTPIALAASGLAQVLELTRYVRPAMTGGGGSTSLTTTLLAKR